jgi:hypothetical protein
MKHKHNNQIIPNTKITVKEFKKLIYDKFKASPLMRINYRKNQFEIVNTFYDDVSITKKKLKKFCEELNINYELGYTGWAFSEAVIIKLS